jgi:hypothetical protein
MSPACFFTPLSLLAIESCSTSVVDGQLLTLMPPRPTPNQSSETQPDHESDRRRTQRIIFDMIRRIDTHAPALSAPTLRDSLPVFNSS